MSYSILLFFFAVFLALVLPPSLFSLGGLRTIFYPISFDFQIEYLFDIIVVTLFILFNISVFIGTRCQSLQEDKFVFYSFITGLVSGQFIAIIFLFNAADSGEPYEAFGRLFIGYVFFILGVFLKSLCIGAVRFGIFVSIPLRKTRSLKPYLFSTVFLLVLIPIHSIRNNASNAMREAERQRPIIDSTNKVRDSTNRVKTRLANIQKSFQKQIIQNDSISEYSYRLFNHKSGYEGEYLKTINSLGKPVCLRRKIFKNKVLIAEDTLRMGESKRFAVDSEQASVQVVNYLFGYNRQEVNRKDLINYCHELIYAAILHPEDAKNIMFIAATIGFSDRPEFTLSEDGLNELFAKLAIAARH